jgi:hypothetical protein
MSTIDRVPVPGGLAKIGVWPLDHCPPHATGREQRGGWTVRIEFSYLNDRLTLMDIVSARNTPGAQTINSMIAAVQHNLKSYRDKWWEYQRFNPANRPLGPCCLHNQKHGPKRIRSAEYEPATYVIRIVFEDGTLYSHAL